MKVSNFLWNSDPHTLLEARVIPIDDVEALKVATEMCEDVQRVLDEIRGRFSSAQQYLEFAFYDNEKFRKRAHEKKGGPFIYEATLVDGSKVRVACHWEFHQHFRKIDEQPLIIGADVLYLGSLEQEEDNVDDPILRAIQRSYSSPEGTTYSHMLKVFLNPSARKLSQWRKFLSRPENLFPEIKHELTHVHDLALKHTKGSFSSDLKGEAWNKLYFNQAVEVRAFMRTVLEKIQDEILDILEQNEDLELKDILMSVLEREEWWARDLKRYLTPENKRKFLLGLVKSLEDHIERVLGRP